MLTGNATLFDGLAAFPWVTKQSQHPSPVLLLDFSTFDSNGSAQALTKWLNGKLTAFAAEHAVSATAEASCAETLDTVLHLVSQHQGSVAVLIDEYDAPILDNLDNPGTIQNFRKGRTDIVIEGKDTVFIIEFKVAKTKKDILKKCSEGFAQFREKEYLSQYANEARDVQAYVLVIDAETHTATAFDVKTKAELS